MFPQRFLRLPSLKSMPEDHVNFQVLHNALFTRQTPTEQFS